LKETIQHSTDEARILRDEIFQLKETIQLFNDEASIHNTAVSDLAQPSYLGPTEKKRKKWRSMTGFVMKLKKSDKVSPNNQLSNWF